MILKLAWRNIWRNKRRSLLTAGSVLFALFFALIMRSMQLGVYDNMVQNVVNISTGYIQVHGKDFWDEKTLEYSMEQTDSLEHTLLATEGVADVVPRLESFSLASTGRATKAAMILGIDAEKESRYFDFDEGLTKGQIFPDGNGILLSEGLAEYFKLDIHDTLVLIGQGYHGISANGKYHVSGILKLRSPELNKQLAFLPLREAQFLFGAQHRVTSLVVVPEDHDEFAGLTQEIRSELDTTTYEVMNWREMMPELVQAIQADSAGGLIMLFVLYLVISFGIFGTILMMTSERQYEYGILISIGMKRGKLALTVLLETFFLSVLGVIGACLLALPPVFYYHAHPINLAGEQMGNAYEEYGFEPVIPASNDPSIILTHSVIVVIITLVLALYAVWKIYRLQPVKAMHS
ncbi:MAG TPA: ABC transporter permease [Cryomorphaceae bacterium]|nr:transporter [Owenweeksia sp.]HAD98179.1 ABC transporter permease [Cryomorphaceae bacterium]HBF22012.1 ABC transporter permease [Cryomorphaceae bacterium]|tara:strand:- start:8606 stop:9823 length:1218 start_codon:yes stop_codon:yes gene_type:complete